MIKTFSDKQTQNLFNGKRHKSLPPEIVKRAFMRLQRIDAAVVLEDLRIPPSHNLEPLKGDRQGQHSIRINKQWRVCFRWIDNNAYDVEITDYH